jgi:transposase
MSWQGLVTSNSPRGRLIFQAADRITGGTEDPGWQKPHEFRKKPWHGRDCTLVKRLRRHEAEVFTFLDHPEVPSDNNHAERQLRPAVMVRKNSYANGSDIGAEAQSVLMSVFRTLKQRGHNPVSVVLKAVRTYLRTGQLPALPEKIAEIE